MADINHTSSASDAERDPPPVMVMVKRGTLDEFIELNTRAVAFCRRRGMPVSPEFMSSVAFLVKQIQDLHNGDDPVLRRYGRELARHWLRNVRKVAGDMRPENLTPVGDGLAWVYHHPPVLTPRRTLVEHPNLLPRRTIYKKQWAPTPKRTSQAVR